MIEQIDDWNYHDNSEHKQKVNLDQKLPVSDDLVIWYDQSMEGAGAEDYEGIFEILDYVQIKSKYDHVLEWCAGPGFFGFGMLAYDRCNSVTFMESYWPCIESIYATLDASDPKFRNLVSVVHEKDLSLAPGKYDFVIGNPPWYGHPFPQNTDNRNRIAVDLNWKAHNNFFTNLKSKLTQDGMCVLYESSNGSCPATFEPVIKDNGLQIKHVLKNSNLPQKYFLVVEHAN